MEKSMEKRRAALASSYERPAPMRTTIKSLIERQAVNPSTVIYCLEIAVLEVVRGEAAMEHFEKDGVEATPPLPGFELFLVRLRLRYFPKARGLSEYEPYRVTTGQFKAMSQDGQSEFEMPPAAHQPEPALIGKVIDINETMEGWIALQVPLEEKKPLMLFDRDASEERLTIRPAKNFLWFKLYYLDPPDLGDSCVECHRG